MPRFLDMARMGSSTVGTGSTIALDSSVTGFNTFAQSGVSNGDLLYLAIEDGSNREVGIYTYSSTGPQLTSRTVLFSTNGGSAISLSGAAQIFPTPLAEGIFTPLQPGGRLCIVTGTPVPSANTTASGTIYYALYAHAYIPINDGTTFTYKLFAEMSVALDATNFLSGSNYDFFVFNDAGTLRLGYGPAWSSATARGTGAGTTELIRAGGLWTNKNTITLRYDSTHTVSVGAQLATYVGSAFASANGAIDMNMTPAAAAGGNNNKLCIFNAYNRVPIVAECRDNTASWTYAIATWRQANGNAGNQINFIDGLGEVSVDASNMQTVATSTTTGALIGIDEDSTSAAPNAQAFVFHVSTFSNQLTLVAREVITPAIGQHKIVAMEISYDTSTQTFISGAGVGGSAGQTRALAVSLFI